MNPEKNSIDITMECYSAIERDETLIYTRWIHLQNKVNEARHKRSCTVGFHLCVISRTGKLIQTGGKKMVELGGRRDEEQQFNGHGVFF